MTIVLRQRLVDIAVAEVGLKEIPGHPNTGPDVEKYQRATWLAPGPWPWCMAFVDWCLLQWIQAPDVQRALGISPKSIEMWRPRSAKAFDIEPWGEARKYPVLPEGELGKMGDLITYDFSHIGILTHDEIPGQLLRSVEGNTNGAGSRDGDGVYLKSRPDSLTRRYVRLLP